MEPLSPSYFLYFPTTHHHPPPPMYTHIHAFQEQIEVVRLGHREQKSKGCVHRVQSVGLMDRSESEIRNPAPPLKGESSIHNHLRTLYTTGQQSVELDIWQ